MAGGYLSKSRKVKIAAIARAGFFITTPVSCCIDAHKYILLIVKGDRVGAPLYAQSICSTLMCIMTFAYFAALFICLIMTRIYQKQSD